MKKIGIIGGIGWPSTIEYYRLICEASQAHHVERNFIGPTPMPEMIIESLNINFTVNNRGTTDPGSWVVWDEYFNKSIRRLESGGAELIVIASVTPHGRLNEILQGVCVPVVSIYNALGDYCNHIGITKLLVLGTMPTMTSPVFRNSLSPFGVDAWHPLNELQRAAVVDAIDRLYQNQKEGVEKVIDQVVRESISEDDLEISAVCLGCTELALAFPEFAGEVSFKKKGITYINSAAVHAASAFRACVNIP